MNSQQQTLAQNCLDAAENNTRTFPEIIATLSAGGFEGYTVDYRRATATYYLPNGEGVELPAHKIDQAVGETFDAQALKRAIREAQTLGRSISAAPVKPMSNSSRQPPRKCS